MRGIPVTSPARTLLDLAAVVPPDAVERAVERAEALRIFDLGAILRLLSDNPRHPGRRALAGALEHYWEVPTPTRSELEDLFLDLCTRHGLPRPVVNARVCGYEVDFLWREQRVIVETDGHTTHGTRAAFERDRARDARLVAAGYRVVRFTYRQVTEASEDVVAVLHSLL